MVEPIFGQAHVHVHVHVREITQGRFGITLLKKVVEGRLRLARGITRIVTGRAFRGVVLTLITSLLVFDPLRRRFATFMVGPGIVEGAVLAGMKV